jgi:hypothetical protein
MPRSATTRLGLSVLLLVSGCASFSPPIPVDATPADVELLTGEWYGHYLGDEPRSRRGTIVFDLTAGEDHAHGSVLMIPAGSTRAYERHRGEPAARPGETAPPEVLTIRFVRAIDGLVSGALDPYWDPERNCTARTTFRGVIQDGTISGTFTTTFGAAVTEASGRWTVTRQRVRPPRR